MPWGDSFIQGFSAMSDARERKKKREQDATESAADRALRLDLEAKQEASAANRLKSQLDSEAARQASHQTWQSGENSTQRGWQSGENASDRSFKTGERVGAEQFHGTQSKLDRDARIAALEKQLGWEQQKFAVEAPIQGLLAGVQARRQAWEENPDNPLNKYREVNAENAGGNAFMMNGGAPSPLNMNSVPVLTPQQAAAAKPGTRYRTTDGRLMVR